MKPVSRFVKRRDNRRNMKLESLEDRRLLAQTPLELAVNLNSADELTNFSDGIFFSAVGRVGNESVGNELWRVDSSGEVSLVKDIAEGPSNSTPDQLTPLGGLLYFVASNVENGRELWRTDGTDTSLVADITQDAQDSSPTQLAVMGGELYFVADNGPLGRELWKTNGTEAGTLLVVELVEGDGDADIRELTSTGDRLYFTAKPDAQPRRLWTSDGTAAGTSEVTTNGEVPADPSDLIAWNDGVYFSAQSASSGREPWRATNEGADAFAEIFPGGDSSLATETNFVATETKLYFSALDGTNGAELWSIDASGNAALEADLNVNGNSSPNLLGVFGEHLLFTADDGNGRQPWLTGGLLPGPTLFADQIGIPFESAIYLGDEGLVFTSGDDFWQTDDRLQNTLELACPVDAAREGLLIGSTLVYPSGSRLLAFNTEFGAPVLELPDLTIDEGDTVNYELQVTSDSPSVDITWDLDGDGEFDDAETSSFSLTWEALSTLGIRDNGSYPISAHAEDNRGRSAVVTATLTVNNVAPILNTLQVQSLAGLGVATNFDARAEDAGGTADPLTYQWDFGDGNTGTGASVVHTYEATGQFLVGVTVADDEGASTTQTFEIQVLDSAPTIATGGPYVINETEGVALDSSGSTDPEGGNLTLSWEVNGFTAEDLDVAAVTLSWERLNDFGITDNGTYPLLVRAVNEIGLEVVAVTELEVENLAPEILSLEAQETGLALSSFAFEASGTDPNPLDTIDYVWDFGDGKPTTVGSPTTHVFSEPGTYIVTLTAVDDDGGTAEQTVEVSVAPVAPVADAGGPYVISEGSAVTLNATQSSDPNGDPLSFAWDLNGDGIFGDALGVEPTVDWQELTSISPELSDDGQYTVTVRATDGDGNSSDAQAILNIQNAPPRIVSVSVPSNANVATSIRLSAVGDDSAGTNDPLTFEWDFGDGSALATGEEVVHEFAESGIYTITVTVRDDDGGAVSGVRTIQITSGPTPPTTDSGGPYVIAEGEDLALDPTNSVDPLGRSLLFLWDLDSDGETDLSSLETSLVSWDTLKSLADGRVAEVGSHRVTLVVATLGAADAVQIETTLTVTNTGPAITELALPDSPTVNNSAAFAVVAEDPGVRSTLSYVWNFGDGAVSTNRMATHVYEAAGTYNGSVTVRDSDGGATQSTFQVVVSMPPVVLAEDTIVVETTSPVPGVLNLLDNDTGSGSGNLVLTSISGSVGNMVGGTYGVLTWLPSGLTIYTLNPLHPDVVALTSNDDPLRETFTYTARDDGGEAASTINVAILSPAVNDVPPQVVSTARDESRFDTIKGFDVTFSEDVSTSLSAADLVLINSISGETVPTSDEVSVSWNPDTLTANFDLSKLELQPSRYQLVLRGEGIQDSSGNNLAGGDENGDYSEEVIVTVAGDANLDFHVNFTDFLIMSRNYLKSPSSWLEADFDGSGTTDFNDFLVLAKNYDLAVDAAFADDSRRR